MNGPDLASLLERINPPPDMPNAACVDHDPVLWQEVERIGRGGWRRDVHKHHPDDEAAAKAICRRCPELTACHRWAMGNPAEPGILAGHLRTGRTYEVGGEPSPQRRGPNTRADLPGVPEPFSLELV